MRSPSKLHTVGHKQHSTVPGTYRFFIYTGGRRKFAFRGVNLPTWLNPSSLHKALVLCPKFKQLLLQCNGTQMSEELRVLIIKVLMKIWINSCSRQGSPQRCPERDRGRGREDIAQTGRRWLQLSGEPQNLQLWACGGGWTKWTEIRQEEEGTSRVHLSLHHRIWTSGVCPMKMTTWERWRQGLWECPAVVLLVDRAVVWVQLSRRPRMGQRGRKQVSEQWPSSS